jgi:orotate phosphoribosyltransferase-like protein
MNSRQEVTARRIARAQELAAIGYKAKHIATDLGLSLPTVTKLLKDNQIKLGKWSAGRKERLAEARAAVDADEGRARVRAAAEADLARTIAMIKAEWSSAPLYRGRQGDV